MSLSFFLGANTKDGFYSLYEDFAAGRNEYLHIIKGGPGTGKSSFMRNIAQAAELRGMETQYILCSGDPDSIDGVFIPRLGEGWVDGTAPHITEARLFGFNSDYVNLGSFFIKAFNDTDLQQVKELTRAYKACYSRAYAYLSVAADMDALLSNSTLRLDNGLRERVQGILSDEVCCKAPVVPCCKKVFISSICCNGRIVLYDCINMLCKQLYSFDGCGAFVDAALSTARSQAEALGVDTLLCLSPLDPSRLEAVLLPTLSLGFVSAELRTENTVPLAVQSDESLQSETRHRELRRTSMMKGEALSMAIERLREAKALHDQLEVYYIRRMNFAALTAYTNELVDTVFNRA